MANSPQFVRLFINGNTREMITISSFLQAFAEVIPLQTTGYAKDAVGLQVGYEPNAELLKILLAYEITDEIIEEALEKKANLIISYHPLIFPNISSITDSNRTGVLIRKLIKNDIALYVIHTAFDTHPEFGTSRLMADALGLQNTRPLIPLSDLLEKIVVFVPKDNIDQVQEAMWNAGAGSIGNYDESSFAGVGVGTFRGNEWSKPEIGKPLVRESVSEVRLEMISERWKTPGVIRAMISAHPYEEVAYDRYPLINSHPKFGMGSIGEWIEGKTLDSVLALNKKIFGTSVLRHNGVLKERYYQVAMVGGAGMEYYSSARSQGADIFITGDIRYHEFYRALHDEVLLMDSGHAETERFVTEGMLKATMTACNVVNLQDEEAKKIVIRSAMSPNVVQYYH
ncbi:MAG: Nif3-like dinuclear metal center hexameric protein [Candidatus Kapaibacterium sp.]